MFAFRSLTLGLLGACFLLLATRPALEIRRVCTTQPAAIGLGHRGPDATGDEDLLHAREGTPGVALPPAVVDVAPGVSASQLASVVRLDAGEHVAMIDDQVVAGDLDAGVKLAALDLRARRYIDLGVEGPRGARRVLVLLH